MILHRHCPLCKSTKLSGYAIDAKRKGPHISRVRCDSCTLVFANPMADARELENYYTQYYEREYYDAVDFRQGMLAHFARIRTLAPGEITKEARYLNRLVGGVSS